MEKKVQAIEYLDGRVLKPLVERLNKEEVEYRLMVLPDHPTPIRVRTHTGDSVPYMLYDSSKPLAHDWDYTEEAGRKSGIYVPKGHQLMEDSVPHLHIRMPNGYAPLPGGIFGSCVR